MFKRRGILYGILVGLLLIMGIWWMYFLTHESTVHAQFKKQKLANDRLHASFLIQSDPRVAANPERWLSQSFPQLVFVRTDSGVDVGIDPQVEKQIDDEARRTRNMFLYEGLFFMILLAAGTIILVHSWRSEMRFNQARELFLAGATHEFKTPLASLKLYTETLNREGLQDSDRRTIKQRMVEDVQRLERLVNEVLSMSAEDTFNQGPPSLFDLVAETESVIKDLQGFFKDHGAQLDFHHGPSHQGWGHVVPFSLALRNLLVNAVNHGDNDISIVVTIEQQKKWQRLTVQDNGPGIPRRLQEKVFDCFYSSNRHGRPAGGAGIGLYLVRRNIQAMGGQVELKSDEGRGCAFTMQLPAATSDPTNHPEGDIP